MGRRDDSLVELDPDLLWHLRLGFPASGSPYGDDELRLAWEIFGDEILAADRRQRPPRVPGSRPWAYWVFEVERPDLIGAAAERAVERVAFLRTVGELAAEEIAELVREGEEARQRIGTDHELRGPHLGDPNNGDRLTVRIAEAARGAGGGQAE